MAVEKAVFLDKDGTLINDVPYNVDTNLITLTDNSIEGLKTLREEGYKLIILSNQSGLALGKFDYNQLLLAQQKIVDLLSIRGIDISGFYYCPHHPRGVVEMYSKKCQCRKPAAGMFTHAAKDHDIDLSQSWMIGDILHDIEAGNSAGCRTVLINNGNETEWVVNERRVPDFIASDINNAAQYILEMSMYKHNIT